MKVEQEVTQGELLAEILDAYENDVIEQVYSPVDGTIFFAHNHPLTYSHTSVYKIIRNLD